MKKFLIAAVAAASLAVAVAPAVAQHNHGNRYHNHGYHHYSNQGIYVPFVTGPAVIPYDGYYNGYYAAPAYRHYRQRCTFGVIVDNVCVGFSNRNW